jgi:dihydrodipicolinate synthase/N-acetylneuraminate lyase
MKRYRQTILATCCVPWNADFSFAEEIFRRQVRHLIAHGIRDLYIFGTAGEGHAVTDGQFDQITRVFLEETGGRDVRSMVGVISLSLPTVIERIERASGMGARRFQISLPSWGALNDSELAVFFQETCGRFPGCEFLHYNLVRAQRLITPPEYGGLAARYPNLVATKNSTTDEARLHGLLTEAPLLQHFITEPGFALACQTGECGLLISMASMNLELGHAYFRAGRDRDFAQLEPLREELAALHAGMKRIVGDSAHMDGAFDKMFCRINDPQFPLRLLPPYSAVSDERFESYAAFLAEKHPRWRPRASQPAGK